MRGVDNQGPAELPKYLLTQRIVAEAASREDGEDSGREEGYKESKQRSRNVEEAVDHAGYARTARAIACPDDFDGENEDLGGDVVTDLVQRAGHHLDTARYAQHLGSVCPTCDQFQKFMGHASEAGN